MSEKKNISVCENSTAAAGEIVNFKIETCGKVIPFSIDVTSEEATLSDIVPAARRLSSKIAIVTREDICERGQAVPCCKGCDSCCSSLIPMSVPEVFRMNEEFLLMPNETSNGLLRNCISAAKRILDRSQKTEYLKEFAKIGRRRVGQINKWYGELGLTCPFLKDGLCEIYDQRPMACREHIVRGSSDACRKNTLCRPNVVPMQVSVLEALGQLASELEGTEVEAIMLPFSIAWAQDNLHRAERTWPAVEMVKRFAEIVQEKAGAKKNTMAFAM